MRKTAEATHRERERIRKAAQKKGKEVTERTLQAAAFTFLLTTVPAAEADAVSLADLYRVRWQVVGVDLSAHVPSPWEGADRRAAFPMRPSGPE